MELGIFKISKNNSEISFCPDRWWLITSIIIDWKELLYMNEETLYDTSKSVRWWIPILFPNAWIINDNQSNFWYNLKQHWFARNLSWNYEIIWPNKFILSFESNAFTRAMFDYDFKLEVIWEILDNNEVKIHQNIINTGNKNLPISCWLHPYFKVPNNLKNKIEFEFLDWEKIEKEIKNRWNWNKTVTKNPWKFNIRIPETWEIQFDYSPIFEQIWIRSEQWKDFVCIEPIIREESSILYNPYIVKIWEIIKLEMRFSFKKVNN